MLLSHALIDMNKRAVSMLELKRKLLMLEALNFINSRIIEPKRLIELNVKVVKDIESII